MPKYVKKKGNLLSNKYFNIRSQYKMKQQLIDFILAKVISYATKKNKPISNLISLKLKITNGINLLPQRQQSELSAKLLTNKILERLLNRRKKNLSHLHKLCESILLFESNVNTDGFLVSKFLSYYLIASGSKSEDIPKNISSEQDEKISYQDLMAQNDLEQEFETHRYFTPRPGYGYGYGAKFQERLGITEKEAWLVELVHLKSTTFTEIDHFTDETVLLMVYLFHSLEDFFEKNNKSLLNKLDTLDARANEMSYDFYTDEFSQYTKPVTKIILNGIYRIAENYIRKQYDYPRQRNTKPNYQQIQKYLNINAQRIFDHALDNYRSSIKSFPLDAQIALNKIAPTRWKKEMKTIRESKKQIEPKELIEKIDTLIERNQKNENLPYLYFEGAKLLVDVNKISALKYYIHHRHLAVGNQSQKQKSLPVTYSKKIFSDHPLARDKFQQLLKELSDNNDLATAIKAVEMIFKKERKKIILDSNKIKNINDTHQNTVERLSAILDTESEEVENTTQPLDTERQPEKKAQSEIQDNILDSVFGNDESSLDDLFPDSENLDTVIPLSYIQLDLIRLFEVNNYAISEQQLTTFASDNNQLKNSLLNSINELFFDLYEDNLITQQESTYKIEETYRAIVKNTIKQQ